MSQVMPENSLSLNLPWVGMAWHIQLWGPFLYTFKVEDPLSWTKEMSTESLFVPPCWSLSVPPSLRTVTPPGPRTTVPAGKVGGGGLGSGLAYHRAQLHAHSSVSVALMGAHSFICSCEN